MVSCLLNPSLSTPFHPLLCLSLSLHQVFDLTDSCKLLCCTSVTLESEPIHKDHSVLLSRHSVKDYVLFAYRSAGSHNTTQHNTSVAR